MKKAIFSSLFLLLLASYSHAQVAKGKYMLGGQLDVISIGGTVTSLDLSGAYFFTDKIAAGISGFGVLNGPYFLGLQGRYLWPVLDKTYIFGQVGAFAEVSGAGGFRLTAYPGVMHFLNERVALEGRIGGLNGGGIGLSLLF